MSSSVDESAGLEPCDALAWLIDCCHAWPDAASVGMWLATASPGDTLDMRDATVELPTGSDLVIVTDRVTLKHGRIKGHVRVAAAQGVALESMTVDGGLIVENGASASCVACVFRGASLAAAWVRGHGSVVDIRRSRLVSLSPDRACIVGAAATNGGRATLGDDCLVLGFVRGVAASGKGSSIQLDSCKIMRDQSTTTKVGAVADNGSSVSMASALVEAEVACARADSGARMTIRKCTLRGTEKDVTRGAIATTRGEVSLQNSDLIWLAWAVATVGGGTSHIRDSHASRCFTGGVSSHGAGSSVTISGATICMADGGKVGVCAAKGGKVDAERSVIRGCVVGGRSLTEGSVQLKGCTIAPLRTASLAEPGGKVLMAACTIDESKMGR
jgi:hypothetical protein